MKKYILIPLFLTTYPLVSSAAFGGISSYITAIGDLIARLTIIIAGVALLVFFWGLVKFITKAGDEGAIEEGRRLMLWGIIALFVMTSVWGIVQFMRVELNIGAGTNQPVPGIIRPGP